MKFVKTIEDGLISLDRVTEFDTYYHDTINKVHVCVYYDDISSALISRDGNGKTLEEVVKESIIDL